MTSDVEVQVYVNGTWTDVASFDTDTHPLAAPITITRGTQGASASAQPTDVSMALRDLDGILNDFNAMSPLYGLLGRNTPLRVLCDADVRATVELASLAPEWDETARDLVVQVQASGIRRRLETGTRPLRSALYRAIIASSPVAYWSLEDGSSAESAEAAVGGTPLTGAAKFGTADGPGGSAKVLQAVYDPYPDPIPDRSTNIEANFLVSASMTWRVEIVAQFPGLPVVLFAPVYLLEWTTAKSMDRWLLLVSEADNTLRIRYRIAGVETTVATTASPRDGEWHHIRVDGAPSGSDVSLQVYFDGASVLSTTVTGATAAVPVSVHYFNFEDVDPEALPAFGHIALWDSHPTTDTVEATFGWLGETAAARMARLCAEESVPFQLVGTAGDTTVMGPQSTEVTFVEILDECADADQGILYEPRAGVSGLPGFAYRTRTDLYNQAPAVDLDYGSRHLSPPFQPTTDDAQVRNDISVSRPNGSTKRYTIPDDDALHLSTQPAPDGVGTYDESLTVSAESDEQLPNIAAWFAHVRSWREQRFPVIGVNLASPVYTANPTLTGQIAAVDLGDVITVDTSAAPRWTPPDELALMARGTTEILTTRERRITFNCAPAQPYAVGVIEGTGAPTQPTLRLETSGSEISRDITTTATTVRVCSTGGNALWATSAGFPADFPMDIGFGGERATATAVAAMAAASFVGAGTAAHGNNASVVPGLPGSLTAGDLLIIEAAIRNSGTGTCDEPSGWDTLATSGNLALFATRYTSGLAAPTVSFTGGVANATTSAQMFAFRDASTVVLNSATQLNSSAANIGTPALAVEADYCLILAAGWKQDDWTGSTTLGGFTEAGDTSSTTGDDQGITLVYRIDTTATPVSPDAFVITGGASAISRSIVVALRAGQQAFTVTRSVNGVVKAHAAGTPVRLWKPPVLAE